MNTHVFLHRIKGLLLSPHAEWQLIADEPATPHTIYRDYVLILALIPAACGFLRGVYLGWLVPKVHYYPIGPIRGLGYAIVSYALSLVAIFIFSVVIDLLAPTYGGRRQPVQALKVAAYSYTGIALGGLASLFVWLGFIVALAGLAYSVFLLHMGLAHAMKSDPDRNAAYTTVSIVLGLLLTWGVGSIVRAFVGFGPFGPWGPFGTHMF
jgi:hypothetical protein